MRFSASIRPSLLSAALLVVSGAIVRVAPTYDPFSNLFRYALETFVIVVVVVGMGAVWIARRRGEAWDADLMPGLVGAVGVFVLLGMLHGTPWGPNGLSGDQSFRTEFITRFASSWQTADYTYADLPAFYPPAYFWVLGRLAATIGLEPWRIVKYGAVISAALVPLVTYLLWRLLVSDRVAGVISILPLVIAIYLAPYLWLVAFAIVPWWVLVIRGAHGVPGGASPFLLGVLGGLLFLSYYYYFFVVGIGVVTYVVVQVASRSEIRHRLRFISVVLGVSALVSMAYWLPLTVSILTVEGAQSLANDYFAPNHALPDVPYTTVTAFAALSLLGAIHLVVTWRSLTSRALIYLLGAIIALWVFGFVTAIAGFPLVPVRSLTLIPIILMASGVIAAFDICRLTARRVSRQSGRRVWTSFALVGALFATLAGRTFVASVADGGSITAAHGTPLPNGSLPPYAPASARPADVSANKIRDTIDRGYVGTTPPVVLSTRADVLALNTYHGFNQWQVYYAHPASQFRKRVAFLHELAVLDDPARFAELSAVNSYDEINAFVLRDGGEYLVLQYQEENFPNGYKLESIEFPRRLFDERMFEVTDLGPYVVVVRR